MRLGTSRSCLDVFHVVSLVCLQLAVSAEDHALLPSFHFLRQAFLLFVRSCEYYEHEALALLLYSCLIHGCLSR